MRLKSGPHPSRRTRGVYHRAALRADPLARAPQDEGAGLYPFDEAIGFGLGVLKLSPDAFWTMTPRELALAAQALNLALNPRGPAPQRADLEKLMERYPDGRRP